MKLSSMKYLFGQGLRNVWTNRVMSFASFCILMVSLLLVGFAILFTANINRFISGIETKNEMVVYVKDEAQEADVSALESKIKSTENVVDVQYISKDQAFDDMKQQYASDPNYMHIFDTMGDDTSFLPASFQVRVRELEKMNVTKATIYKMDFVDTINAPDDFASLLTGLRSTVAWLSTAIVAALVAVSMVIISNSTRASVFARRREINIMKYVGATNSFIRIPFFVEGMVTGALAGGAAAGVTWFAYNKLVEVLSQQMSLWQAFGISEFIPFSDVRLWVFGGYIAAGALLGAVGCVFSTGKHLKV